MPATEEDVKRAYAMYLDGAPEDVVVQETGKRFKDLRYRGCKPLPAKERAKRLRKWRLAHTDWTPLDGITPCSKGRGYATFSREEQQRIKDFYRTGHVPKIDIARHLGVHISIIDKIIINKSIRAARPSIKTLSGAKLKALHRRHMAGESCTRLAATVPCAPCTLRRQWDKMGLAPSRATRDGIDDRIAEAERLLKAGHSRPEIAKRIGVDVCTVTHYKRRIRARVLEREVAQP